MIDSTTWSGSPASSSRVTTVCRRSWNRSPGRPAASRNARQAVSHFSPASLDRACDAGSRTRGSAPIRVTELVGALEHRLYDAQRVVIQRKHSLACLVLALSNVQRLRVEIDILPAHVLHLDTAHRRVRREHGGAVDVLPFRIAWAASKRRSCSSAVSARPIGAPPDSVSIFTSSSSRRHCLNRFSTRRSAPMSMLTVRLLAPSSRRLAWKPSITLRVMVEPHVAEVPLHDLQPLAIEFHRALRVGGRLLRTRYSSQAANSLWGRSGHRACPPSPLGSVPSRAGWPPASSSSRESSRAGTVVGGSGRRGS